MLGVVGQKCCVRLQGAKSLTGFKLCETTCNRMCKRTQHVTSNNVGSCWPTILRPFVRGFIEKISVYKQTFLLFKCAKHWNKKSFALRANNSLVGTLISISRWRQPYLRYTDPEETSFWLDRNLLLICFINAWVALPYNFTSCSFLKTLKVKLRFFSLRNITILSGK